MSAIKPGTSPEWTAEQRAVLERHGIDPKAWPRGLTGDPTKAFTISGVLLRDRVCQLDDVDIDHHEASDLDPAGGCIHCRREWAEIYPED